MYIIKILFEVFAILCFIHYIIDLTNVELYLKKYSDLELLSATDALSTIYTFIYLFLNMFFKSGPIAIIGFIMISTIFKRSSTAKIYLITIIISLSMVITNNLILQYDLWEPLKKIIQ